MSNEPKSGATQTARRPYEAPTLTLESRVGPDTSKNNTRNFDNHTGNSGISGPS